MSELAPFENLPLQMLHHDLRMVPQFHCPPGISLVNYEVGFDQAWTNIHKQADHHNDIDDNLYRRQFGEDESVIEQRQLFLVADGKTLIGTATAWFDATDGRGRVHWVAILPQYQGRGLAKPLLSGVCDRLLALGHSSAVLSTSTARVAAVCLYLKFGFTPLILVERDYDAWAQFQELCGRKG
jgi:GNAT superfamily N-acetyltransferase